MQQRSSVIDVEGVLTELRLYYEKEKTFDDLKYRGKLRFDYYVREYNLCIEFNGAQHYEYVEYFHKDISQFDEQRLKDHLKREYCWAHKIHLIELPCSLTSEEIRAEIIRFLKEHDEFDDETFTLLPEIESFLKLNESHTVYINLLYAEYKRMLKDLNIDDISNYKTFYDYVIDYWRLKDKQIIKDKKGKYVECWINDNIEYNNQQRFNNDTVLQHYYELENLGVFTYSHIPSIAMYEHYKYWLKLVNPGSEPMHQRGYTKKISNILNDKGYSHNITLPLKRLSKDQFDINIFDNLHVNENLRSKIFINPDLDIKNDSYEFNLNSNDMLLQQLKELENFGLFNYSHIPTTFLYEHYKLWLKENNPGSKPLKQFDYSRQIKNKLKDFGYTESKRQKHRYIKKEQFDFSAFDEFNLNIDTESLKQATVCINPDLDIEQVIVDIENDIRELSYEEFYDKYNEQIMKSYLNYLVRSDPTVVIDILSYNGNQYKIHEINKMSYEEIVEYLIKYNQGDERESDE